MRADSTPPTFNELLPTGLLYGNSRHSSSVFSEKRYSERTLFQRTSWMCGQGEYKANLLSSDVSIRVCAVSYKDERGIRHGVEVEAESVYEAAVRAVAIFRGDPWSAQVGPGTALDVEVREPSTTHSVSLQQVERWLAGATPNPTEASRKVRLKMMLMRG
jgi:hypothetical protein